MVFLTVVPKTNEYFDISIEFLVTFYVKNMLSKYSTFSIVIVKTISYGAHEHPLLTKSKYFELKCKRR